MSASFSHMYMVLVIKLQVSALPCTRAVNVRNCSSAAWCICMSSAMRTSVVAGITAIDFMRATASSRVLLVMDGSALRITLQRVSLAHCKSCQELSHGRRGPTVSWNCHMFCLDAFVKTWPLQFGAAGLWHVVLVRHGMDMERGNGFWHFACGVVTAG